MSLKDTMFLERLERQAASHKNIYSSRLYNAAHGLAGIFLFDLEAGVDLSFLKKAIKKMIIEVGGTMLDGPPEQGKFSGNQHRAPSEDFCQVTVEERTQLFGFMKKG